MVELELERHVVSISPWGHKVITTDSLTNNDSEGYINNLELKPL